MIQLKRAISITELESKKFKLYDFDGKWAGSFGPQVDSSGSWMIYGNSGNGKTSFTLQLAKHFSKFGKVAYNTLEEGARFSFQTAIKRQKITAAERKRIQVLHESIEHINERLKRKNAPDIIIIDSIQFSFITKREYFDLTEAWPTKIFIWISHADGTKPQGALAKWVHYHADVKIWVEGFRAMIVSRFGGNDDFIIDKTRSDDYWSEIK